ncbi:MAG TPA: bifunctional phosphopantothenoylcysteine decarboxylase/phosphopantothenate--cysteine ligase CoaBC [Actinomycetota bacterium]|nr:bifunctional phosphopantothenoylcysteine decarboxylase/phosphopantothenate--cysteine ligase CoaBC [Actinomycetota bacterium]
MLLGVSGGIAAYKAALVARLLEAAGADVTVVLTENATRFIGPDTFSTLTGAPAHTSLWERPGEVLHVRLAREADVAVVVPATANVLAKLAHGHADDLLSATLLEATCPLVIAPAMHSGMWEHPATQANVEILRDRGVTFVGPAIGALAHGDEGIGRLEEPEDVVAAVRGALAPQDLAGHTLLLTSGPTHEPIDPVRFVGNRSTGKMGAALAAEALGRGASVTVVLGPGAVVPPGVEVVPVQTTEEMRDAVLARFDDADAVVMAAAVADFRPKAIADAKLKKDAGVPELLLEPTPDILAELGERRGDQVLVGFAAETEDLEVAGRQKLTSKHLDLVVVNLVGRPDTGFGADTDEAMLLATGGEDEPLRRWTKRELAAAVMDRVAGLLGPGATSLGPGG